MYCMVYYVEKVEKKEKAKAEEKVEKKEKAKAIRYY